MRIQNLLGAALLLAGTAIAAAEQPAVCDFTAVPPAGVQVVGNLVPTFDPASGIMLLGREPHQNKGVSGGINIPLKTVGAGDVLTAECEIVIGNTSPKGNTQVSGRLLFDFSDARGKKSAGFTVGSKRYHRDRKVFFTAGGKAQEKSCSFAPDRPMTLKLTLDRAKNLWHGEIVTGGKTVFSSGELPLDAPDFIPARLRVIAATANNNDGMKITVKPPAVTAAPAAR